MSDIDSLESVDELYEAEARELAQAEKASEGPSYDVEQHVADLRAAVLELVKRGNRQIALNSRPDAEGNMAYWVMGLRCGELSWTEGR